METICVPFSEIRKKVASLGMSEEQFSKYLIYLNDMGDIYNGISKEAVLTNVRLIFHPTQKELDKEKKYLLKIISKGFPYDYQGYLSSTLFSKVKEFLVSCGSSCL